LNESLIYAQEYDGDISFATDAWTSPNHYAYVALTAHFETKGQPITIVLDVVEVAKVVLVNYVDGDAEMSTSHTQV
jgi:hypothetical protein